MNKCAHVSKQWQFDFYRIGIVKRKRFSKWHKQDKIEDDVKLVMREYDYSHQKALQIIDLLSEIQLKELREKYNNGGR
jgi:cupin superfamily acireductone dioxygenase involved in methionine salvage